MPASQRIARLKWPILLLIVLAAPALMWDDVVVRLGATLESTAVVARHALATLIWLVVAWVAVRLVDVIVWEGLLGQRIGGKVPRLLKDVVAALIFGVAITGILALVYDLDVTGLWATSGVVGLVVGLALQSMILDVFSGIALNVDRPFLLGDWVRLSNRARETIIGEVVETSWRSTRLRTIDGTMVIVPNGWVAREIVTNLTRPYAASRFTLNFCLEFSVPTDRAMRILEAGVRSAKGVLATPAPKVRVNGTTKYGVEYEVRYWLMPRETSPSKGRHRVGAAVLDQLHRAGLTLAYEKHDIYTSPMPPRQLDPRADRGEILHRVVLFADLEDNERAQLGAAMREHLVSRGVTVVSAGDSGDSMYIVVEGLLEVRALDDHGAELVVGHLAGGDFFGEMSLLTGEPRSATVVAATDVLCLEIRKEHLGPLLAGRPDLAHQVTEKVAERKLRNELRLAEANAPPPTEAETRGLAAQILGKMRDLFGF